MFAAGQQITYDSAGGLSLPIIGALLGHTQRGMLRTATERGGAIIAPGPAKSAVTPIRRQG